MIMHSLTPQGSDYLDESLECCTMLIYYGKKELS